MCCVVASGWCRCLMSKYIVGEPVEAQLTCVAYLSLVLVVCRTTSTSRAPKRKLADQPAPTSKRTRKDTSAPGIVLITPHVHPYPTLFFWQVCSILVLHTLYSFIYIYFYTFFYEWYSFDIVYAWCLCSEVQKCLEVSTGHSILYLDQSVPGSMAICDRYTSRFTHPNRTRESSVLESLWDVERKVFQHADNYAKLCMPWYLQRYMNIGAYAVQPSLHQRQSHVILYIYTWSTFIYLRIPQRIYLSRESPSDGRSRENKEDAIKKLYIELC